MENLTLSSRPQWTRSSRGIIAGVCLAIAEKFGVPAWLVRFFWLMSILFAGTGLLLYAIIAICLPRDDRWQEAQKPMIFGVCVRIAQRTSMEVGVTRLMAVLMLFISFGAGMIGYILLHFLMPLDTTSPDDPTQPQQKSLF